jgi:hypothetical protein
MDRKGLPVLTAEQNEMRRDGFWAEEQEGSEEDGFKRQS